VTFFEGVKAYSDPSYIFSGIKTPNPQDLRPYMRPRHYRRHFYFAIILENGRPSSFTVEFRKLKLNLTTIPGVITALYLLCDN